MITESYIAESTTVLTIEKKIASSKSRHCYDSQHSNTTYMSL